MVTNNDSGNTGSEGVRNLCECLPHADERVRTALTNVMTKKLAATADSKKNSNKKYQTLEACHLIEDVKESVKFFNQTGLQNCLKVVPKSENDERLNYRFETRKGALQ